MQTMYHYSPGYWDRKWAYWCEKPASIDGGEDILDHHADHTWFYDVNKVRENFEFSCPANYLFTGGKSW